MEGSRCKSCGHFFPVGKTGAKVWSTICPDCGGVCDVVPGVAPETRSFFKKLFGRKESPQTKIAEDVGKEVASVNSPQTPKEMEITLIVEGLAGGWPSELSRETFKKINMDRLITRLLDYKNRSYPGPHAKDWPSKPEYEIEGGKVGRVANPAQDIKIVQSASILDGSRRKDLNLQQVLQDNGRWAFNVIEHYAQTGLARFLFLLPTAAKSFDAISQGKKAIIVTEHLRIDVYKGVENVLLEIWDELPEGGHFDDFTVSKKLLSIVESAK